MANTKEINVTIQYSKNQEKIEYIKDGVNLLLDISNNSDSCLNSGPIRMIQYSEKTFVVIGDTKNQSTSLNKMGGKLSILLTYKKTGEKFTGWLFTNYKKEMVGKWIDSL